MNKENLEKRVEVLEQEISVMRTEFEKLKENKKPWWERNAGMFANNELFDEAVKAGQVYRENTEAEHK